MQIIEKDFTISHDGDCWTLHLLKSKKELKENSKESYKTGGYYTDIFNAINAALQWRQHKKYPFKEPIDGLKKAIKNYKNAKAELKTASTIFYQSIFTFKKEVFNENKPS